MHTRAPGDWGSPQDPAHSELGQPCSSVGERRHGDMHRDLPAPTDRHSFLSARRWTAVTSGEEGRRDIPESLGCRNVPDPPWTVVLWRSSLDQHVPGHTHELFCCMDTILLNTTKTYQERAQQLHKRQAHRRAVHRKGMPGLLNTTDTHSTAAAGRGRDPLREWLRAVLRAHAL